MTSTLRGGGGLTKCRRSKGGCLDLVLWILPKCRQGGGGGPKSQKLCRRHLSMVPTLYEHHRARAAATFQSHYHNGGGKAEPFIQPKKDGGKKQFAFVCMYL